MGRQGKHHQRQVIALPTILEQQICKQRKPNVISSTSATQQLIGLGSTCYTPFCLFSFYDTNLSIFEPRSYEHPTFHHDGISKLRIADPSVFLHLRATITILSPLYLLLSRHPTATNPEITLKILALYLLSIGGVVEESSSANLFSR